MDRIDKFKALSTTMADPVADIGLINQYAVKELKPEDVFCFSVILCDNEVDRDIERFPDASLEKMAKQFLGRPVITDHRWSAEKQVARLYRTWTEDLGKKNSLGEMLRGLKGSAYMLRSDSTSPLVQAVEGGIIKEVSVGGAVGSCNCSICGKALALDWRTWTYQCENGHIKGQKYDSKLCFGELVDPKEAYELSFVAVPAQRGAGVTKNAEDIAAAIDLFKSTDINGTNPEDLKEIIRRSQLALAGCDERAARAKILAENEKFVKGNKKNG